MVKRVYLHTRLQLPSVRKIHTDQNVVLPFIHSFIHSFSVSLKWSINFLHVALADPVETFCTWPPILLDSMMHIFSLQKSISYRHLVLASVHCILTSSQEIGDCLLQNRTKGTFSDLCHEKDLHVPNPRRKLCSTSTLRLAGPCSLG